MPNCRICSASNDYQVIRAPIVFGGHEEHNFWECEKCNSIYLYPIPSIEEEKKFYLREFEGFMSSRVGDHRDWSNAKLHKESNQDQIERRFPFLEKYILPNKEILEIGCSSGFMMDAFKSIGANCIGVEPSGAFSDYLESQGYEVYEEVGDIKDKKFDVIANFFVFEHIRDPFRFLSDCYNLLNEGGVIICEIPCANDPLTNLYNIQAFESFYWSIAHHYYYTPESITYILDKLGFKYEIKAEQRYDISNHISWMQDGRPGGQGKYSELFGKDLVDSYRQRMIDTWNCDTIFLYVWK